MTVGADPGLAASEFLARAAAEAERYGGDEWVFVRELVQNARDAGARSLWFDIDDDGRNERLTCRDDGCGMSIDEARRHLFTLYASGKSGADQAGRFGVGFWSILAFEPEAVVVMSRPPGEMGWRVRFARDGTGTGFETCPCDPGTTIILERSRRNLDLEAVVRSTIERDAPFVVSRDGHGTLFDIRVGGRRCSREFALPAPSIGFRHRGLRGVVGLAEEPGVQVFAHGLRVRSAVSLEDLLVFDPSRGRKRRRMAQQEFAGLHPRVLIDSAEFDVLMHRGDVRDNPALRRAVALAQREMTRLIRRELDHIAPRSVARRAVDAVLRGLRRHRLAAVVSVLAGILGLALASFLPVAGWQRASKPGEETHAPTGTAAYRDLADLYRGPELRGSVAGGRSFELQYQPSEPTLYFAAFRVAGLHDDGSVVRSEPDPVVHSAGGATGGAEIEVGFTCAAERGWTRLPAPPGFRVLPSSPALDGERLVLYTDRDGSPMVRFEVPAEGRLTYVCAEGGGPRPGTNGVWPDLPPAFGAVREWRSLPVDVRVERSADFVVDRVRYQDSPSAAARLAAQEGRFFDRVLEAGVGDCDIQSAVLTAVLRSMDVEASMVVGWVGRNGRAGSVLHSWVEYVDQADRIRVLDPTLRESAPPAARPTASSGSARTRSEAAWSIGLALGASALLAVLGIVVRLRFRRSFRPGSGGESVALVRGALGWPSSFDALPSLFTRPIVPTLSGRRLSLDRARRLADEGRLFAGSRSGDLVARAAAAGLDPLDSATPVGRVVAENLGAADLGEWQTWHDRGGVDGECRALESLFAAIGVPALVRTVENLGEPALHLRLGSFRLLVLDPAAAGWEADAPGSLARVRRSIWAVRHLEIDGLRRRMLMNRLARDGIGS